MTQANPSALDIVVTVAAGQSPTPLRVFRPGEPVQPVAVGSASAWRVFADGVARTHFFVAFDGTTLFVSCAVAEAPVLLAGTPVGREWTPLKPPTELRFGAAVVSITTRAQTGSDATPESAAEHTIHDGGALYAAAQRARQSAASMHSSSPPPAQLPLDASAARQLGGPPYEVPRAAGVRTTSQSPPPPAMQVAPSPNAAGSSRPPSTPPIPGAVAMPSGPPPPLVTIANPADEPTVVKKREGFWASASPVKKATLLLLPLVLGLAFFVPIDADEPAQAPAAARVSAASAESATPAAPSAPASAEAAASSPPTTIPSVDASGVLEAVPAAAIAPAPKPAKARGAPETRTPERIALDTAAGGSFVEAARLYDALSAAHPENPTYKNAARILRERMSRGE